VDHLEKKFRRDRKGRESRELIKEGSDAASNNVRKRPEADGRAGGHEGLDISR